MTPTKRDWSFRHTCVLVGGGYALLALLFMGPAAVQPDRLLFGERSDNMGSVWILWWIQYAWRHALPWQSVSLIAVPYGWPLGTLPLQYPAQFTTAALALLVGEITVYNLYIFWGLWASAVAMYVLVIQLTHNRTAAFIAGLMYGFAPYHLAHAQVHMYLAAMQWLPLYLLALFRLDDQPSLRRGLWWGLALAAVVLDNYYYGYLIGVATVAFIFIRLGWNVFMEHRWPFHLRYVKAVAAGVLLAGLLIAPAAVTILGHMSNAIADEMDTGLGYVRQYDRLSEFAARWWHYVLPPVSHPVWGNIVRRYAASHGPYRPQEHSLFLGYTVLILAAVALTSVRRASRQRFEVMACAGIALVALIFSVLPTIALPGGTLPTPSSLLYRYLPMFRVYARFGALVMLCVVVLAGIGLSVLLSRLRRHRRAIACLAGFLVLFEFINVPPWHYVDLHNPASVYTWLAEQPGDFVVAEYPLEADARPAHYEALLNQRVHQKRLLNGPVRFTEGDLVRLGMTDLSAPDVPAMLAYRGVRYIVLREDGFEEKGMSRPVLAPQDFRLVMASSDRSLYEVLTKPPDRVLVLYGLRRHSYYGGFYMAEHWQDNTVRRWMADEAHLVLFNPGQEGLRVDARLPLLSPGRDTTVRIYVNDGFMREVTLPAGREVTLALDYLVVPPGPTDLRLQVPEGMRTVGELLGNGDTRRVGVALREVEVLPHPWSERVPPGLIYTSVDFGDQMRLVGFRSSPESVRLGGMLSVNLAWQALAPMAQDYTASVRLMQGETVIAQLDRRPLENIYPTSHWRVGEVVTDTFQVPIPMDVSPGEYTLGVVMYDLDTLKPLPVSGGRQWTELDLVRVDAP